MREKHLQGGSFVRCRPRSSRDAAILLTKQNKTVVPNMYMTKNRSSGRPAEHHRMKRVRGMHAPPPLNTMVMYIYSQGFVRKKISRARKRPIHALESSCTHVGKSVRRSLSTSLRSVLHGCCRVSIRRYTSRKTSALTYKYHAGQKPTS